MRRKGQCKRERIFLKLPLISHITFRFSVLEKVLNVQPQGQVIPVENL